ncbi:protein CcmA, bactofilin family [Jannaschia faecimaris]|uniref:Protein CcmA, bactofilin family n=1 Tax=Jannaschia faecimaris TaxID=1244108 RepID=A0A1H3SSW0_9RHOB|nr:hypothetical protein [Jannaschia faecimaris]SDZ40199.1 protein CcmA, bactofilin family [Jannaschia faecimaris]
MTYRFLTASAVALAVAAAAVPTTAEQFGTTVGGDRLVSGARVEEAQNVLRDLLVSGAQIVTRGQVAEDVHAAGFSIDVEGRTGGDVTAAGARVRLDGEVGGDVTLSGFIVTLDTGTDIAGNARLFGGTATSRGSVDGSLVVVASEVFLDGPVGGDVRILADTLSFGPDARVDGQLTLALPEEITVPPDVATAGRVSYEYIEGGTWNNYDEMGWEGMRGQPSAATIGGGYLLMLAFLLATGATFLALMPNGVANMRRMALNRPGLTILTGGLGISALIGVIPVAILTVIGIPLVPIAVLAVILAWILGYLLGAYVLAMAIAQAAGLGDSPSFLVRLAVLAAAVTGMALLNFIPFVGWVLNVSLVFLGVGAMTEGVLRWAMPNVGPDDGDEMMKSESGD